MKQLGCFLLLCVISVGAYYAIEIILRGFASLLVACCY